jgi:hypothetical protein
MKQLEKSCMELMEFYDTVLIIVTKNDLKENSTSLDYLGMGNHFANKEAVVQWLKHDEMSLCNKGDD